MPRDQTGGHSRVEVNVGERPEKAASTSSSSLLKVLVPILAALVGGAGTGVAMKAGEPAPEARLAPAPSTMSGGGAGSHRGEYERQQRDAELRLRTLENDKIDAARWRQSVTDSISTIGDKIDDLKIQVRKAMK